MEYLNTQHQHTEHTALGQNAGKQRACGSRSHGVRFRQPDMQRRTSCFCAESEQYQYPGSPESSLCRIIRSFKDSRSRLSYLPKIERAADIAQQHDAHQHDKSAYHGYGKISSRGLHRVGFLRMGNKSIRSQRHYLKENKCGIQIIRKENTDSRGEGPHAENVVTHEIFSVRKIVP